MSKETAQLRLADRRKHKFARTVAKYIVGKAADISVDWYEPYSNLLIEKRYLLIHKRLPLVWMVRKNMIEIFSTGFLQPKNNAFEQLYVRWQLAKAFQPRLTAIQFLESVAKFDYQKSDGHSIKERSQ